MEIRFGGQPALLASSLADERWICLNPVVGAEFVDASEIDFAADPIRLMGVPARSVSISSASTVTPPTSIAAGRIIRIDQLSDGVLRVSDYRTQQLIGDLTGEQYGEHIISMTSFAMHGRPFLATGSDDGVLGLWDLNSLKLRDVLLLDKPIKQIVPAPHDYLVVVTGEAILAVKRSGNASEPANA
jgi:WD40 repeat protein